MVRKISLDEKKSNFWWQWSNPSNGVVFIHIVGDLF
jgi:hypothetical protein